MKIWKLAAALLVLVPVACNRAPQPGATTISEERFVEAYLAVSRVRADTITADTARADSLRLAALAEHNVTEAEMREFVSARARNPQRMAAVWDQIRTRLEQGDDPAAVDDGEEDWNVSADGEAVTDTAGDDLSSPQRLHERLAPRIE